MLILSAQQLEGDPYETLTQECSEIVSADVDRWHDWILASPPFSGLRFRSDARWSPILLVFQAILMVWEPAATLIDRFQDARNTLIGMFPYRRRPGKSYQGFLAALLKRSDQLLRQILPWLRSAIQQVAGPYWTYAGFACFSPDGTRIDCPRTQANEQALGCGGRKGTGPQFWLTTLWHMGTGLPWAWKIGRCTDAERPHLRQMLELLPINALLIADAGFVGYDLLCQILGGRRSFLIRVGSNVRLLRKLGYAQVEDGQTVYLWPQACRKHAPPLVLRLIELTRKGKKMYLVTNVSAQKLSNQQAAFLYEMRWGVELFFRSMKQTLARRKMLSHAPRQARVELSWSLVGLQLLGVMSVWEIIQSGKHPLSWSVAGSLRAVRKAMKNGKPERRCRGGLRGALSRAIKDSYHRTSRKQARNWPHKKREKPPGAPQLRDATISEVKYAQRFKAANRAA